MKSQKNRIELVTRPGLYIPLVVVSLGMRRFSDAIDCLFETDVKLVPIDGGDSLGSTWLRFESEL